MTDALMAAADALYGDSPLHDPYEMVSKANPDGADVHSGNDRAKRERTQARVGLASNVVGIAAGTAGLKEVAGRDAFREGGKAGRAIYRAGSAAGKVPGLARAGKVIARHPKAAAAGALGLQAANLAGDAVSNRVLARSASDKGKVKKGLAGVHANPKVLVLANGRARRAGLRVSRSQIAKGLAVDGEIVAISKAPWTKLADAGHVAGFTPAKGLRRVNPALNEPVGSAIGQAAPAQPSGVRRAYTGTRRAQTQSQAAGTAPQAAAAASTAAAPKAGGGHRATTSTLRISRGAAITAAATGTAGAGAGGMAIGQRRQQIGKSEVSRSGAICKVDDEKRQVFAWASIHSLADGTVVCDLQGDIVPVEEIEKSAYTYMLESRVGGHMHLRTGVSKYADSPVHVADVIESLVVTPEKEEALGLPPNSLPYGWWLGMQVNDDAVWQDVRDGKITGLSIHGSGMRKAVE